MGKAVCKIVPLRVPTPPLARSRADGSHDAPAARVLQRLWMAVPVGLDPIGQAAPRRPSGPVGGRLAEDPSEVARCQRISGHGGHPGCTGVVEGGVELAQRPVQLGPLGRDRLHGRHPISLGRQLALQSSACVVFSVDRSGHGGVGSLNRPPASLQRVLVPAAPVALASGPEFPARRRGAQASPSQVLLGTGQLPLSLADGGAAVGGQAVLAGDVLERLAELLKAMDEEAPDDIKDETARAGTRARAAAGRRRTATR